MQSGTLEEGDGKVQFVSIPPQGAIDSIHSSWPADHFPKLGELPLWLNLTDRGKEWLRCRGMTLD